MSHNTEEIYFNSNATNKKIRLGKCRLDDLFPHLLLASSNATIEPTDNIFTATFMLSRLLESFTNCLVVSDNEKPIGALRSLDILKEYLKKPNREFFDKTLVKELLSTDLCIVDTRTKLSELIRKMKKSELDFAILQHGKGIFSTISTRRLVELGTLCDTNIVVSQIQAKNITFCGKNDSIKKVILSMIANNTNVVIIENTPHVITSKLLLEKILNELRAPGKIHRFLDSKINALDPYMATIIPSYTTIPDMCKIMLQMKHPYIMTSSQLITPYDLGLILGR